MRMGLLGIDSGTGGSLDNLTRSSALFVLLLTGDFTMVYSFKHPLNLPKLHNCSVVEFLESTEYASWLDVQFDCYQIHYMGLLYLTKYNPG